MTIENTKIPGLLIIHNDVHADDRGFFVEKFQKAKLIELGFPEEFNPVQINSVFNERAGVLRGIHAEPWEKYVSVANGKAFAAYLDLREGQGYGAVVTVELNPETSVFIPRGVGNSYQTLEPNVNYLYAVNGHWQPDLKYIGVNPFDTELNIAWPISKEESVVSDKDKALPILLSLRG